jgi:hypothetical protein
MKKLLLLTALMLCCIYYSVAQQDTIKRRKIYETWIYPADGSYPLKGVLYEIKDSLVLISNSKLRKDYSTGNFQVSQFYYNNIDFLKVRKVNRIKRGALIGSALGLACLIPIATEIAKGARDEPGKSIYVGFFTTIIGVPLISFGAGTGALIGSVKIRIPINGQKENFDLNRNRLEEYSYMNEYPELSNVLKPTYEHKTFFEGLVNASIPLGDFADNSSNNPNADYAKNGGSAYFILGHRFTPKYGMSISVYTASYNINQINTEDFHEMTGIMAGPMFSVPFKDKLYFDVKPMIVHSSSNLLINANTAKHGKGFGFNLSTSLNYNFSKHWCAFLETGFLSVNQKFDDNSKKNIQTINLGAGIGYRFR